MISAGPDRETNGAIEQGQKTEGAAKQVSAGGKNGEMLPPPPRTAVKGASALATQVMPPPPAPLLNARLPRGGWPIYLKFLAWQFGMSLLLASMQTFEQRL